MSAPDFRDLHRELVDEFFYYADAKGRVMSGSWLDELKSLYWRPRSFDFMIAAANLPGSKLLLTVDDASELPMLVRKALMVVDHVIIRHNHHLPVTGMSVELIPFNAGVVLGQPKWAEENRHRLTDVVALPHYRSTPPPEIIAHLYVGSLTTGVIGSSAVLCLTCQPCCRGMLRSRCSQKA